MASPLSNLRDRNQYRDRAWDWAFLNSCFEGTRIRLSDVDGVVEHRGQVLFVEAKPTWWKMGTGQRLLLEALARKPGVTVLFLEGVPPSSVTHMAVVPLWKQRRPATQNDVQLFVRDWFDKARGR